MVDLNHILDTHFGHLTPTRLRNKLAGMDEECFIDLLQEGEVEVSEGTVRQAAQLMN